MPAGVGGAISFPSWAPNVLPSITAWFNPATSNSLVTNASGGVTIWSDLIGNVSGGQPTGSGITSSTAINGFPSVSFDGTSYLTFFSVIGAAVSASAWTALIVFRCTNAGAESASTTPYNNAYLFGSQGTYFEHTISTTSFDANQYDGAYKQDATPILLSKNYYAITKYDGSKISTSLNGSVFDGGVASGNIGNVGDNPIFMGVSSTGSGVGTTFFTGAIGDVIFYNTCLPSNQITQLMEWAAGRYQIL